MSIMNRKPNIRILLLMLFSAFACTSCIEKQQYPNEPQIEYKDFLVMQNSQDYDSLGFLVISFTDGDGDLGLSQADTLPPFNPSSTYYYNYFIKFYQQINGIMVPVTEPYNGRIPDVNPEDIDIDLAGEIEIEIDLSILAIAFSSDTIQLEAYIVDRALNHSNTIKSPVLVINPD